VDTRFPNPARLTILAIGLVLARLGLVDAKNVRRTTDLAWPRIVTGIARMSKNAVDVAFSLGGGFAGGTIALVSQRYGAEAYEEMGQAIRSSVALVLLVSLPVAVVFWLYPAELVSLMTGDERILELDSRYLHIISLGVPLAALNLVGSRIYIGADDAWTPMVIRAGGAVTNIVLSAVFVFQFGMGVAGAAWGTLLSNVVAAAIVFAFARPIVLSFVSNPNDPSVPYAITLVYVSCIAILAQGVNGAVAGPLDASGDTRWPFMAQAVGMFLCSILLAYLGTITPLALGGLYLSYMAETTIPAVLNYYRFSTGRWKVISRQFRPEASYADD
jgi:Na+-driven multidrug efflux pump